MNTQRVFFVVVRSSGGSRLFYSSSRGNERKHAYFGNKVAPSGERVVQHLIPFEPLELFDSSVTARVEVQGRIHHNDVHVISTRRCEMENLLAMQHTDQDSAIF